MISRVLDLGALRAFIVTTEHRSFAQAAKVLNLTQSGVSMRIRRLEETEGVLLFERSHSTLVLTPAGKRLLGHARDLLTLNDEAQAALHGDDVSRPVRLGVMEDYATRLLPSILADFAADMPWAKVDVETGMTSRMLPDLGRRFDLLLAMHRPGTSGDGVRISIGAPMWVAAPCFAIPRRGPLPLALYAEGCQFRAWALEALRKQGRSFRIAYSSASAAAVEAAAASGVGITVVREGNPTPALHPLEGLPQLPEGEIRLHRATTSTAASERLAELLVERLAA